MADSILQDLTGISLPVVGTDVLPLARGTDPLTKATVADLVIAQSQVTNLTTDLSGKLATSSLATGVQTFLGTPSSANLAAAVTDETGTGALVFAASPTLSGTVSVSSGAVQTTATAIGAVQFAAISPTLPTTGQRIAAFQGGTAADLGKGGFHIFAAENWSAGASTGTTATIEVTPAGSTTRAAALTATSSGTTIHGNATATGVIVAGSAPTTLTDSAGKVLSAALNTVAAGQGGTGSSSVPSAGQIPVGNAGGTAYAPVSVSGDATLASTGALTIADDAVTFAKMQNVAGNSVLARAASGSGNVSEVALGASELLGRGSAGNVAAITLGSGLSMSGTTLSASGGGGGWTSGIIFRIPSSTEIINNSTTETSCFSGASSISVPGGTLGSTGIIRFCIAGQLTNSTGANQTVTLRIKYGGTTYYQDATPNIATNANPRAFRIDGELLADNSTSAQRITAQMSIGPAGVATTGYGDLGSASGVFYNNFGGTPTEDSTADKDFDVTLAASTASTAYTYRVHNAYVSKV